LTNVNAPNGLRPARYLSGKSYNGACRAYYVPATYATTLYLYDPVVLAGGANTNLVRGHQPGTLPVVTKAAAGASNRITGVIVGFEPVDGAEAPVYGKASTERIALVADDPDLLFSIKDDGYAALTASVVSKNAMLNLSASGSTITGVSGATMDSGTTTAPSANANGQLTILGAARRPDNALGQYANWLVRINLHSYAPGVAGV
jgi:hypothetical protein